MLSPLWGLSWAEESPKKVYIERGQESSLSQKIGDLVKDSAKTWFNYLLEQFGEEAIPEAKISADFNPTQYRLEHVRDAFLIVDDLLFLKEPYLPPNGRKFEYVADYVYKDAQYVYDKGTILDGADP